MKWICLFFGHKHGEFKGYMEFKGYVYQVTWCPRCNSDLLEWAGPINFYPK